MSATRESRAPLLQKGGSPFHCIVAGPGSRTQFFEVGIRSELFGNRFETTLVGGNRDWCVLRQLICPLQCVAKTSDAMNATLSVQLFAGIDTNSQQHVSRHRPPELVAHAFDRPLIHRQTQLCRRHAELTGGRCHAKVASDGQLGAGTERRSVDGGQSDARQVGESTQCRGQRRGELIALHTCQISPGAESRRGAGEYHHSGTVGDFSLEPGQRHEALVIHRIATLRTLDCQHCNALFVPFHPDGCLFCFARLYHQTDCMTSEPATSDSASVDPVRARRQQVAKYTLLANRIGYLLFAVAISCFVFAFAVGFSGFIVTLVTINLVAGSILLAPSIVLGYAVKAAEREDRENGL
jgi:hypothetical protein